MFISAETSMDFEEQLIMANGKVLDNDSKQVKSYQVGNNDMIVLSSMKLMQAAAGLRGQQPRL